MMRVTGRCDAVGDDRGFGLLVTVNGCGWMLRMAARTAT